jgi:zinc transporter 1/2/3
LRIPPRLFFFCKHFGTGVLIATAFVHLLPTAFESLTDPCLPDFFTKKYPALAGVIGLMSLFSLFAVEMWMHTKLPHAHSHGSATGEEFSGQSSTSHHPPGSSQVSEFHYIEPSTSNEPFTKATHKQRNESFAKEVQSGQSRRSSSQQATTDDSQASSSEKEIEFTSKQLARLSTQSNFDEEKHIASEEALTRAEQRESKSFGIIDLDPDTVDPAIYKKMSMEITLLEGGILFHSIFVGMTVSITVDGFIVLLIAILFHQVFEGLGLGSRIAAVPYKRGSVKPWVLVFAFGTTAPIGQVIGLAVHGSYDPQSAFALILVGTFNAM